MASCGAWICKLGFGATFWWSATGCGLLPFPGDGQIDEDEVPEVGWEAELRPFLEEVSGRAVIVDGQTIEISDFTYDGRGLNTRFYLVADGLSFTDEVELSGGNWVREDPYDKETITMNIPETASFVEWNVITFWEVPVGLSFGHGQFLPPKD